MNTKLFLYFGFLQLFLTCSAAWGENKEGDIVAWGTFVDAESNRPVFILSRQDISNVKAAAAGGGPIFNLGGFQNDETISLVVKEDGTVTGWGNNANGTAIPASLSDVRTVAAGRLHGLALKQDGTVVGWGSNSSGQITIPANLSNVVAIAAGSSHSMALKNDGMVVVWGGSNLAVPSNLSGVVSIATGSNHCLALKSDGTVLAWGNNSSGQATVPNGLSGIIAISASGSYSLALKEDGTVVTWGSTANGVANIPPGLSDVKAIAAGARHALALKNDGSVVAWGSNDFGQTTLPEGLNNVKTIIAGTNHSMAIKEDGSLISWRDESFEASLDLIRFLDDLKITDIVEVDAGDSFLVALKNDGTVVNWGRRNDFGQLDIPEGLSGVVAVDAGSNQTAALKDDGAVVCWGTINYNPGGTSSTPPPGLKDVITIAAGSRHVTALKSDGTVVAWGVNNRGYTAVPPDLSDVRTISTGEVYHTVALKGDGTVAMWGDFAFATDWTDVPAGLDGVVAIAPGGGTVALRNDGTVVAWGYNYVGERNVPQGLSGVVSIATGNAHTLALKNDGSVVAWGYNSAGQTNIPEGLSGVKEIAAGGEQSVLMKEDGTVIALGGSRSVNGQVPIRRMPKGLTGLSAIGLRNGISFAIVRREEKLEARSRDLGLSSSSFNNNFAIDTLSTGHHSRVQLVDMIDTAPGAECFYVNTVIVPASGILDMNGLKLYARTTQIAGKVINGTIQQLPDSGPVTLNIPVSGAIANPGELDEWSFLARGGSTIAIVLDTGGSAALPPKLGYAQVTLLNAAGETLSSAENTALHGNVTFSNVAIPADGIFRIRVRAASANPAATGNYHLAVWDVMANSIPLSMNQRSVGDLKTPFSIDTWHFSASAGQQVKFDLLSKSPASVFFKLEGPAGFVGFQDTTGDSDLINLPASGSYTLTAYGRTGQDGAYGFAMQLTSVTSLAPGVLHNGTWAGSGQAQIFSLPVTTISPLLLALSDSDASHRAEVYIRFGSPPTRQIYDFAVKGKGANHDLMIPSATAGTWYILVYGESIPNNAGNFTLLAQPTEVVLTSTSTAKISPSTSTTITLTGAGFNSGSIVRLVGSSGTIYLAAGSTTDLYTQMTATFAANTIPPGTYTIRITQSSGAVAELPAGLSVVAGQAVLATSVEVPSPMGQNVATTLYVNYANTGNAPMPAPLLILTGTNRSGLDGAFLTLDGNMQVAGFWTSALPSGYTPSVQILASGATLGVLAPGESARIPVYYAGWLPSKWTGGPALDFSLKVIRETDTTSMDWLSLETSLKPPGMPAASWSAMYLSLRARLGTTSGGFVRLLNSQASYLSGIGQKVTDVSKLWSFLIAQSANYWPVRALGSEVDGSLPTPGNLSLSLSRAFNASIPGRFQSGPFGLGWFTSWHQRLEIAADGTVTRVTGDGGRFTYQPDRRSTTRYFSSTGDQDVLTSITGGYKLTALDGTLTVFKTDGTLDYLQDTNGNRITVGYTGGRLTSLTASSDQSLTLAYNAAGLISTLTDSAGRVTTYGYDMSNQHLLSVTAHSGLVTAYAYNTTVGTAARNALTTITSPDGSHQYLTYDTQGRLAGTSADGGLQANTLTYADGKVSITDATAKTSSLYFNQNGQIAKFIDPLGNATYLTHDSKFNLTSVTNAVGARAVLDYNKLGQLISAKDFLGNITNVTYGGPQNQPKVLSDAKGNQTRYDYSPTGNLLKTTFANGSLESTTFDPLGNALSFTNAASEAIQYSYNAAGQVTGATFPDGSNFAYTYDNRGRLLTATDASGTITFTYHPVTGFMTGVAYPEGRALTFTYDTGGRRSSMVDHTGFTVKYGYDAVGRLSTLRDAGNSLIVTYTFDANGRLNQKTNANGTYSTYTYDANGRVLSLINRAPGGAINSRFDDTYNALGLKTSEATLEGAWTFTYDANGQLTRAVFASNNVASIPNQDLAYQYDALGNRVKTVINGVTTDYVADSMNQYVSAGGTPYDYDSKGNLLSDGTNTFTYNVLNKLVGVSGASGTTTYTYNAIGQRVSTTTAGQTTKDLIDPSGLGNVVGTFGSGGGVIAQYVHGLDLTSQVGAGGSSYYDSDVLGSIAGMSGAGGSYTNRYSYLPFGGSLQATNTVQNPFQFVGAAGVENEGNGVLFMRLRFMHVASGRFTSFDPIGLSGGDINLSRYVENSPINSIDPLGLKPILDLGYGHLADYVNGDKNGDAGQKIGKVHDYQKDLVKNGRFAGEGLGMLGGLSGGVKGVAQGLAKDALKDAILEDDAGILEDLWPWESPDSSEPTIPGGENGGTGSGALAQSMDPNAVYGPSGYGPSNFVSGVDNTFAYRVTFENFEDATAPAQSVTITNNLDSNLDWSTFQLTGIGFADNYIVIPPGNQHYQATISMTYNGLTFDVEMETGIHSATGQVYASFYSIDPNTSLPPANVLTGFLPPEDGTGRGEGFISYTVSPKSGLATGVVIPNIASIVFDSNPPITTDQLDPLDPSKGTDPATRAFVTIDSTIPHAQINTLPSAVTPSFIVSWRSASGAGGSGVASYSVYVSSDSGQTYTVWLANTTRTSAVFIGQSGKTYLFYVLAKSNVGNVQQTSSPISTQVTASVSSNGFNETLNFNNNQLPKGWAINVDADHLANTGVANKRFESRKTNTYSGLYRAKKLPATAGGFELSYLGNITANNEGQSTEIVLYMEDGSEFDCYFGKASGGLQEIYSEVGSSEGPQYTANLPLATGSYNIKARVMDEQITYTVSKVGSRSPLINTVVAVPGLVAQRLAMIEMAADTTGDETSWFDNVVIKSVPPVPVKYAVSVQANPASKGTATGSGSFKKGARVTVRAKANRGSTFVNWTENGIVVSSSATFAFTATANRNLVANFQ